MSLKKSKKLAKEPLLIKELSKGSSFASTKENLDDEEADYMDSGFSP